MADNGMNDMGEDTDERTCPDECRGETREACSGCPYFNEDGEAIG